jgi:hypothetical protein
VHLPAKHHQIILEVERSFGTDDPQLVRTLERGKVPSPRYRLMTASSEIQQGRRGLIAGMLTVLLCATVLAIGLELNMAALICLGVPLAKVSPIAICCVRKRVHQQRMR